VQGVIVGASRVLEGGLAGGNQLDRMMVMEARSPIRRFGGEIQLTCVGTQESP
jgi:hypothetical protein